MIKRLITLSLLLLLASCQKDEEPPTSSISEFTLDIDSILCKNSIYSTTGYSPLSSLPFTATITKENEFTAYINGIEVPLQGVESEFTGEISLQQLLANTSSGMLPIELSLKESNRVVSTLIDTLHITNSDELISVQNPALSPSVATIQGDILYESESKSLDTILLSFSTDYIDTLTVTIGTISKKVIAQSGIATIPFATAELFPASIDNSILLPIEIHTKSNTLVYNDKVNFQLNSHFADPYEQYAWHINSPLKDFGTTHNISDSAHIGLTEAWKTTKGSGITIAIIDQGFEVDHEDLSDNIIGTYNAANESSIVNDGFSTGHGTTCAGFAASPLNGVGLAGAAPEAKLLLIADPNLSDAYLIRGFEYAKNQGADVISCSWGSENVSQVLSDKMQELYDAGIVIVFAAGNTNDNFDLDGFNDESELPTVIGVGASDETNDRSSYSNYGSNIDVLCPGGSDKVGVLGPDRMGGFISDDYQMGVVNENYAFTLGTSFSAPLVAGVAALVLSVNPTLTPDQVRTILIESCDKFGKNAHYSADGFATKHAYGKINAAKAVELAKTYR